MLPIRLRRAACLAVAMALLAAACAEPDLGPPSSTTLPIATPTPTPEPEPDPALGPSNTTTTTVLTIETTPTPTPTPVPVPVPGLSDTTLRIGVIADVTTGALADDRGESAWNAVLAWARAVNDAGGLAGRQVVVQPIDSAVFSHDDALREACEQVFALVGSWSIDDGNGLDILLSPDCSLPDFPAEARSPARRRSPTTYQSNPLTVAQQQAGAAQYFVEQFPDEVTATGVPVLDAEPERVAAERLIEAYTISGVDVTQRPTLALDADLSVLAQNLTEAQISYLVWTADADRLAALLGELDFFGGRPAIIDCGQACYDATWVESAGPVANGVSVWLTTVPLEEVDTTFELTRYVFWLGRTRPEAVPDAVGIQAWASALLFEESVRRATNEGTPGFDPELLSRSAVLDAAETITEWNANGLHGDTNPADGVGSPCFVLLTLIDGVWQRTHPFGRGLFDCEEDNLVTLESTAELGLAEPEPAVGPGEFEPLPTPTLEPEEG